MKMKEFFTEYITFATDTALAPESAKSYVSYLRNACKNLCGIQNHLELIAESDDADVQAMYAEQMNVVITTALKDATCTVNKKTLRNNKSAVALLIALFAEKGGKAGGAAALPSLQSVSEYSKKDLKRIFLSRLKTQDRFSYSYGVFAARILCKIAAKNKVKLFEKLVDNIKFLYAPDITSFFRLKEIDKLIIGTDGHAYIEKKGKMYPVYTESYRNGQPVGFEIAEITMSRQLSLDHDTPMFDMLKIALHTMPEYKKLSDDIKRFQKANSKATPSALSKKYYDQMYSQLPVCEDALLTEIATFLDNMQLTIMHASYNSSKNKN